jgi:ribosome modulation factor
MSRAEIARAITAGNAAGKAKQPVTQCPYPHGSLLRSAWVRGYARARPLSGSSGT